MKSKTEEIFEINSDILALLNATNEIGWLDMRQSTLHRLMYLTSVLYAFRNNNFSKKFKNYHFSLSPTGPYSESIERSIIDLTRREIIIKEYSGKLSANLNLANESNFPLSEKLDWFRIVVYLLGIYGEDKIFGFIIHDPQYKYDFQRNSIEEIDTSSINKTIKKLNEFKSAFEETLEDTSEIDNKEYLELYFEYVFSKIIKKEG